MPEIGEAVTIALAPPHEHDNAACPFCPPGDTETWKTYPGLENDSGVLSTLLEEPEKLARLQSGARPKQNGTAHRQAEDEKRPMPACEIFSFEAHHLISGKQALAKAPAMEAWIFAANGKVECDSGYSVNNTANGMWLPSIPKALRDGTWGPRSHEKKYPDAKMGMQRHRAQIHIGAHNIQTVESRDDPHYGSYDTWLIEVLQAIADRIRQWAEQCPICQAKKDKEKPRPSAEMNAILDRFSRHIGTILKAEPLRWRVFISKYAYWYHLELVRDRGPSFDARGKYQPMST